MSNPSIASVQGDNRKGLPEVLRELSEAGVFRAATRQAISETDAETFHAYDQIIDEANNGLLKLSDIARQLNTSRGITSSALSLRDSLQELQRLFEENATDLFPSVGAEKERDDVHSPPNMAQQVATFTGLAIAPARRDCPEQLKRVSQNVLAFLDSVTEFPGFPGQAVTDLLSLDGDLKYWASCLDMYKGRFKDTAVQQYIHAIASEIGLHTRTFSRHLITYMEHDLPTIRSAQTQVAANLLTVATFFSAVTATTIGFSVGQSDQAKTPLQNTVNGFWFTSLVFSVSSAVNSLLGLTWRQAIYWSPTSRVPRWVSMWIQRSPVIFLMLAIVCFSVGLVLFSYYSKQNPGTSITTLVLTSLSGLGLTAVLCWIALERWSYTQVVYRVISIEVKMMYSMWTAMSQYALRISKRIAHRSRRNPQDHELAPDQTWHDYTETPANRISIPLGSFPERPAAVRSVLDPEKREPWMPGSSRHAEQGRPKSPGARFAWAIDMVLKSIRGGLPRSEAFGTRLGVALDLMKLTMIRALPPHRRDPPPRVEYIQFSRDGRFLAATSSNKTSAIFDTQDEFSETTLLHFRDSASQVEWSPDGNRILTKLDRQIQVWTARGVRIRTIERPFRIQFIQWIPGSEDFLSLEGNIVTRLNLVGDVLKQYTFKGVILHDFTMSADGLHIFCAATLTAAPDGSRPKKCKPAMQIIVIDVDTGKIEIVTPVLDRVQTITMAKNDPVHSAFLVTYQNSSLGPQVWNWDKTSNSLVLKHTYMRGFREPATLCCFGGGTDDLVICANKDGDIFMWDRDSEALLHDIRPSSPDEHTSICWNGASSPGLMFATGNAAGEVKIWATSSRSEFKDNNDTNKDRKQKRHSEKEHTSKEETHRSITIKRREVLPAGYELPEITSAYLPESSGARMSDSPIEHDTDELPYTIR